MAKYVKKNTGKNVNAWELGKGSEMEQELIKAGKIVKNDDGYELFSQESKSGSGEKAKAGDFFKVDGKGYPYPNAREWFFKNHRHIDGDTYEQLPKKLMAWESTDGITPEVQFLVEKKGLVLDPTNPKAYFGAMLWGAWETASADAVLIFYSVSYAEDGTVIDADFNFVARSEFEATYHYE